VSEHNKEHIPSITPDPNSSTTTANQSRADDSKANASGPSGDSNATPSSADPKPQTSKEVPADPFDPKSLGISTDYAAAISAQASTKPFELRKPNGQEFFRTSPFNHQRLLVGAIADQQEMSKLYVVQPELLDQVKVRFPKSVRVYELVLTQSLVGTAFLWGVPLSEDRGGSWNSSQRDARHKGESRWTNMASGRGQYDVTTIDNSKEVVWDSFPPMIKILRQALSDGRLINTMDHPLLCKLRGEIE
jgi:hypothetical protein